jgi:hypothetical protein
MAVLFGDRPARLRIGILAPVLLAIYVAGVVALFASGRLDLVRAGEILAVPVVGVAAVLRPEWVILILLAVPPAVLYPIPPRHATLIMVTALFGFLLQGRIRLGPETGIYPLVGIVALGIAFKANVPPAAAAAADGQLKFIVYYIALILVGFHTAAEGKMEVDRVVNALLVGLVAGSVLQAFATDYSGYTVITQTPFQGKFAYLAAMGFGITYVRLSLRRSAGRQPSAGDSLLMWGFLCFTAIGFGRAAWTAALSIFALVSIWTGRKAFWIVSSLFLVLVFTVPVVGERVFPGGSLDTSDVTLARVSTGRSELWGALLERGVEALPFGHGWGYTWSLTSTELFGIEGEFTTADSDSIFPHDDFLFLFLELGTLGFGLLVAFWLHLLRKIRLLSRSHDEQTRYDVRVLVPVIIVMFFVQLFDNGLAIRFVAERFFIAAGFVFGLQHVVQDTGYPPVLTGARR